MGQFSKNCRAFYPKIDNKLSKIWVWDPRSGIRKKPIPDPGSRGSKRHWIPDPDPQHWLAHELLAGARLHQATHALIGLCAGGYKDTVLAHKLLARGRLHKATHALIGTPTKRRV